MPRGRTKKAAAAAAAVKSEPVDDDDAVNDQPMSVEDDANNDDDDVHMASSQHVSDDNEDDDDPIVREIDVYISPQLGPTATLIQYPIRPSSFIIGRGAAAAKGKKKHSVDDAADSFVPMAARSKPRNSMLELDYALPATTSYNSTYHATIGNEEHECRTFLSQSVPVSTHMALGKLDATGKRLDLIPLHSVLQMRPSFRHIDESDPQQQAAQAAAAMQQAAQQSAAASGPGGTKPLLFKKRESDRSASARRQSYAHMQSEREAEEWVELEVVKEGDDEHGQVMSRVKCTNRSTKLKLMKTKEGGNRGYVASLNYLPVTTDLTGEGGGEGGSDSADATLPNIEEDEAAYKKELTARIATLLTGSGGNPVPYPVFRGKFVGYDGLLHPNAPSEEILIECLSSTSVLVRGNFVLKTNLCGLSRRVAEARDVCLLLFHKYGKLRRKNLLSALTQPNHEMDVDDDDNGGVEGDRSIITEVLLNQLLEPIAIKGRNCMVLRVEDDETFGERFPDQSEQHQQYWEKREEALGNIISAYDDLEDGKAKV